MMFVEFTNCKINEVAGRISLNDADVAGHVAFDVIPVTGINKYAGLTEVILVNSYTKEEITCEGTVNFVNQQVQVVWDDDENDTLRVFIVDRCLKVKDYKVNDEVMRNVVAQWVSDICNLLIVSEPGDGPMVKGVIGLALTGLNGYDAELDEITMEKVEHIREVYQQLCRGRYDLLSAHPKY